MATSLKNLQVIVEGDASSYTRMASDVQSTNLKLVESQGRYTASLDQTQSTLGSAAQAMKDYDDRMRQMAGSQAQVQATAAAANDNYKSFSRSVVDGASGLLETVSHLKLLALTAYAISPAFRSFTNAGVTTALGALGANFNVVSVAATRVAAAVSPALAFISRLSVPIGIAVAGFKLLSDTVERGSTLLEKYGGTAGQRSLFGQNVDADLAKVTRLQDETLSLQQVQYATQLGTRLEQAKQTLGDILKVHLDLTDPALRLQNAWVVVVETLAKAVTLAGQLPDAFQRGAQAIGNSSVWNRFPQVSAAQQADIIARLNANNGTTAEAGQMSQDQAFELAKKRLSAGMGGGFVGRFNQSIMDLANPPKPEETKAPSPDAWNRYADQVTKANAALIANTQSVGLGAQAHEQLKVQLQGEAILERDGVADTDARRTALEKLAKSAGDAALALEKAKLSNQIDFDRKTAFFTPDDLRIAQELRGIYGNDIPAALASSEASQLRFNATLKDINSTVIQGGLNNLTSNLADITTGTVKASDGFKNLGNQVVRSIEEMIIKLTIATPLAKALQATLSGFGGGVNLSSIFGGGGINPGLDPYAGTVASANGNVFDHGRVIPYALGGILSDIVVKPTMFPMANGAGLVGEAGPEAILPLKRGADGKLGVAGGSGGGGGGGYGAVSVNVFNAPAGTDASTNVKRDGNGGISIDVMLTRKVKQVMQSDLAGYGDITQGIGKRFGLDPTKGMSS